MSREHLYRAKRANWRELPKEEWWVEGAVFQSDAETRIATSFLSSGESEEAIMVASYLVDPETVCEYTGLTDKNDRKIFENDIIGRYSEYRKEWYYGVVKYGEFNCSCCSGVYGWYFDDEDIRDCDLYEVRSNIFDNPELLEGGKAE